MPTIIKVHEVEDAHPVYINADYIVQFCTVNQFFPILDCQPLAGQNIIEFAHDTIIVKESPDEIAALISEAKRGYDIEFRPGSDPSEGPEADIPPMRYGR